MVLYGIKNCDTVKKARKWLESETIPYSFHDFRQDGLDQETLRQWCKKIGWNTLLNRRSTTWKKLPEEIKQKIDETTAIQHMLANPTLIKRPVLVIGDNILCGFQADMWRQTLSSIMIDTL